MKAYSRSSVAVNDRGSRAYPATAGYPRGRNFLVSPIIKEGYVKEMAGLLIDVVGPSGLLAAKLPASSTRQ